MEPVEIKVPLPLGIFFVVLCGFDCGVACVELLTAASFSIAKLCNEMVAGATVQVGDGHSALRDIVEIAGKSWWQIPAMAFCSRCLNT